VHLPTADSRSQAERMQVSQAMRPAPVLSPDALIRTVLDQMKDNAWDAWPVGDAEGLRGMIRSSELEQAADEGASNQKIAEILGEGSAGELPHVHPDHSLSLALERMGTSGLNVLPVVSRANLRQLLGIITLDDILEAYGVAKRSREQNE